MWTTTSRIGRTAVRRVAPRVGKAISIAVAATALVHTETSLADPPTGPTLPGRWYTQSQVNQGLALYRNNCAVCHGERAQGARNWEQQGDLGFYPPPPLDGGGHSTHHPLKDMVQTVTMGGTPLGGSMPAFSDLLREPDIRAVLAYVQSLWPDEAYKSWEAINSGATPAPKATASERD